MSSLAEQIANLANPAPIFDDPEDATDDRTAAKLAKADAIYDDFDSAMTSTTSIRRKSSQLLEETSLRYSGKKVSRKALDEESDVGPEEDEDDDNDDDDDDDASKDDENEGEEEAEEMDAESDGDDEDNEKVDGSDEDQSDDENEETDASSEEMNMTPSNDNSSSMLNIAEAMGSEDSDAENSDDPDSEDGMTADDTDSEIDDEDDVDDSKENGIRQFSSQDSSEEKQKGEATRAQLNMWDSLLKSRIELQKLVTMVNQMPQPEVYKAFCQEAGADYQQLLHASHASLKQVLDELVRLQNALLQQNPETKHVLEATAPTGGGSVAQKRPASIEDSDEEIPSDSDAEPEEKEPEETTNLSNKRIKIHQYPDFLSKRHKAFHEYRNSTIQKWHDKTRVASGKIAKSFSAFEQSALKQIDQILSDRPRLVQRTQLKRTVYRVLGKPEKQTTELDKTEPTTEAEELQTPAAQDSLKDYDAEIFDDGDFYHQLLRELIERKTNSLTDPIALSRQWLEIQKLRSKVKRKVDTKASKGRKIRYDIHPKLVNFVAPCENSTWTDEARNDLYSSLFGQRLAQTNGL